MRNRSGVLLAAVVIWIVFALVYPLTFGPWRMRVSPLPADRRAMILRLPDEGPLSLIVRNGTLLTLAHETSGAAGPPDPAAVAGAVRIAAPPMPASPQLVAGAAVMGVRCTSRDRSSCYAVVSVPEKNIAGLMTAGRVWAWIEQP